LHMYSLDDLYNRRERSFVGNLLGTGS
jgi:hypothetical protein